MAKKSDDNAHKDSPSKDWWDGMASPQFWVIASVAIILVLLSIIIELGSQVGFLKDVSKDKVESFLLAGYWEHGLFYSAISREIGFALIIALIIGAFVERQARNKHFQEARRAMNDISRNAFGAVLGNFVPKEVSEAVIEQVFKQPIIRRDYKMTIRISELDDDERKELQENKKECAFVDSAIRIDVTSRYLLENITGEKINHDAQIIIPLHESSCLASRTKVSFFSVGNKHYRDVELDELLQVDDNKKSIEKRYVAECDVEKGSNKMVPVAVGYTVYKNRRDNEIWASLIPTIGIELTINFQLRDSTWHVDTMHSSEIEWADGDGEGPFGYGEKILSTNGVILPFQGTGLFWRPAEKSSDEAKDADAPNDAVKEEAPAEEQGEEQG